MTWGKEPRRPRHRILRWMVDHDDKRLFLFGYVGLTLFLTIGISLFWLCLLVSIHFTFECLKKYYDGAGSFRRIVSWSAWDTKFDLALVSMALVLLVVTEVSFGFAGVAGFSRFSAVAARFSGASRGLLPIKDLILAFRIICTRKLDRRDFLQRQLLWTKKAQISGRIAARQAEIQRLRANKYPWQESWSWSTRLVLGIIVVNMLVIPTVILMGETPLSELLQSVGKEMHPWPYRSSGE